LDQFGRCGSWRSLPNFGQLVGVDSVFFLGLFFVDGGCGGRVGGVLVFAEEVDVADVGEVEVYFFVGVVVVFVVGDISQL
jgi:hypothetical protein